MKLLQGKILLLYEKVVKYLQVCVHDLVFNIPTFSRVGRMAKDPDALDSPEMGQELTEALSAARAWMEIVPEKTNSHPGTLLVGEDALLMVKSTLPGEAALFPL